ncbi:reticulon-2 [Alligator mississippiensis]|uniref:Reticulon-2 n=1 Tax=Alligator mississippiensis TaxID=8496 RepID=A0A151N277_ALLMI|nr:reticulon-2 [Alligator mississippiensis]
MGPWHQPSTSIKASALVPRRCCFPEPGTIGGGDVSQLGLRCPEESPSTASTTPDSTDGGTESDFPELQTAREFSEDEDTALGDSLENIPSLCQSPEGERGQGLGLDPFSAWDAPLRYTNDPEPLEPGNSPPPQPQLVPTTKATVDPGATKVTEAAAGSETALEVAPGDLQLTPALALHPAEGTPCRAEGTLSSSCTLEGPGFQGPWDAKDPQEEKAFLEMEPIPEQRLEELDQSGNPMEAYNMGKARIGWL